MHLAKYRFNHALGQTLEYMLPVFPPKAVTRPNEVGDGLPDMKLRVCFVPRQGGKFDQPCQTPHLSNLGSFSKAAAAKEAMTLGAELSRAESSLGPNLSKTQADHPARVWPKPNLAKGCKRLKDLKGTTGLTGSPGRAPHL